jgi:hypothetical protein
MLRTVPVEGFDVDEDDPFDDRRLLFWPEGLDQGRCFGVVFMDLDPAKDLEARLVGIVHEEKSDTRVVIEVSQADVLLIPAQIREAKKIRFNDADEAFRSAAMLYVRPAGLADRCHVEAVPQGNEGLFVGTKCVSRPGAFREALILSPAAMLLLMLFDERRKSQFLKATTHGVLDPGRWTRCLTYRFTGVA